MRSGLRSSDGGRELYAGQPLPHFNEVDECAGLDALVTNRLLEAMHLDPATTLHDVRWGEHYRGGGIDDFVWVFQISGAVPASHIAGGYAKASSERQPPMYFRLGGGTLKGICKPGHVVWSRVFVEGRHAACRHGPGNRHRTACGRDGAPAKVGHPPVAHHACAAARHHARPVYGTASCEPSERRLRPDKPGSRSGAGGQSSHDGGARHPCASLWRLTMLVPSSADTKGTENTPQPLVPRGMAVPFFLVTALFFLWGVPNNLNDVLIRQFMKSFAITRFEAGLVQSAFYLGYFLLATPAALLMRRVGYKFGIVVGLLLFAVRDISLLAGSPGGPLWLLSFRAVCHCQRACVPGDGVQPVHCPTWPSGKCGETAQFFPGFQSPGCHLRRTGGHGLHLFRS